MGSVIERKLARKRRGSKVGNLLHHSPSELSNAERRGRLTWLLEAALAKSGDGLIYGGQPRFKTPDDALIAALRDPGVCWLPHRWSAEKTWAPAVSLCILSRSA